MTDFLQTALSLILLVLAGVTLAIPMFVGGAYVIDWWKEWLAHAPFVTLSVTWTFGLICAAMGIWANQR